MATLYAGSKAANLRKSLAAYVQTRLETTRGLSVDWGQSGYREEGKETWIQYRFQPATGRFQRLMDDSGRVGELKDGFLIFNLFERVPSRLNIYALATLYDAVVSDFYLRDIPVYDYDTAGAPLVGSFRILEITNDGEIDGGEATGLRQHNLTFRGRYLFKMAL